MAFERSHRSCLWFTEISKKAYRQRLSKIAPVFGSDYDAVGAQEFYGLIETSARQCDMTRMKFGARDDSRLSESGQPHRLGPIEFRILERSDPHQPRHHPRRQAGTVDVNLIGKHDVNMAR